MGGLRTVLRRHRRDPGLRLRRFLLNQFAVYGIYGMLALSISLCWGFGGILNLGQGIAFGLAAYGMAMTMQMQSQDPDSNPIPPFMLNNSLEHLPGSGSRSGAPAAASCWR